MRLLDPLLNFMTGLWRGLRALPYAGTLALLLAVAIMMIAQAMGYHQGRLPWMPESGADLMNVKDWQEPSRSLLVFYYLLPT